MDVPEIPRERLAEALVYIGLIEEIDDLDMIKTVHMEGGNVAVEYTAQFYTIVAKQMELPFEEPTPEPEEDKLQVEVRDSLRRL